MGGGNPSPTGGNRIQYIDIATTGDAVDFGDTTHSWYAGFGFSDTVRGIAGGGNTPDSPNNMNNGIDVITIRTTGNATEFGDLTLNAGGRYAAGGASNATRGLIAGGNPSTANAIQFITIASTGDAQDFGDLQGLGDVMMGGGMASPIRAIFAGNYTTIIESVEIASTGNSKDFGDMTTSRGCPHSNTDSIRGVISGGYTPGSTNSMEYIQIMTQGNGVDFGDLVANTANGFDTVSTAHGGL